MTKKLIAILLCLSLMFSFAACGGSGNDVINSLASSVDTAIKAQGREYENLIIQQIGETTANSFFEWTVKSVRVEKNDLGGYPPSEGTIYLIADILVTNIFTRPVPVGSYDYIIVWGDGDGEYDYAYQQFYDEMFPDDITLEVGESVQGEVVFEVPITAETASIIYEEIYDDDFVGNTYCVNVDLSQLVKGKVI